MSQLSSPRILVIDGVKQAQENIRQALRQGGVQQFVIHEAFTGRQGLALYQQLTASSVDEAQVDLILLDLNLPDLSSIELLRQLKGRAGLLPTPVIVLTSAPDHQDIQEALALGVRDHLAKATITPELLSRAVRYAIQSFRLEQRLQTCEERCRLVEQKALAAQEKFARVFRHSPLIFTITSLASGRLLDVNELFLHTTGYTRKEVIGRTPPELGLWVDAAERERGLPVIKRQGFMQSHEATFRTKNGQEVVCLLSAVIIELDGQSCVLTALVDITENKKAEGELKRERELLQKLFDHIPVMITMYRPDTSMLQFNRAFERITGWSPEEARQLDMMEKCYPDPAYREMVERYMASLQEGWLDIEMTTKDGEIVESAWSNIRLSDDTHIGIGIDLSERKHAEQALRKRTEQLHLIADNLPGLIAYLDAEERYQFVNATYERWFCQAPSQIIGCTVQDVVGAPIYRQRRPYLRMALEGKRVTFENTSTYPDGKVRTVLATYVPDVEPDGRVAGLYALVTDISDLKQAEQSLQQLNTTLEQRVAERTAELEHSNRELDQFAYVASHDLKAPLRAIAHLAHWIGEDAADVLPAPSKEHLAKLRGRIYRMETLLDDLLAYSRAGRQRHPTEPVQPAMLIQNVVELLAPPPGFKVNLSITIPVLHTERVPLETVFRNLIGNAIKHHHRPAQGCVDISAREQDDFIEFAVSDDGPGIDQAFHQRIFEMFSTLQPRDQVEGSGVGLAVVKKLVESRGQKIQVESSLGKGAVFRFTWPRTVT